MPDHAHTPATCRQCEKLTANQWKRHWKEEPKPRSWHFIARGPDLLATLPKSAHFVTILAYCDKHLDSGEQRYYRGPLYAEFDGTHAGGTLRELLTCLNLLQEVYDLPLSAVRTWHSGGRGYHMTIPAHVFGGWEHPRLPEIYKAMIEELFPASIAPTLDRGVYSSGQGRMWRLPNRRRDNGRYKVPLAMREALHRPAAELEALTRRPRHGRYWPDDAELSPCPALVHLYQQVTATVRTEPRASCLDDGERIPAGQRNQTLASLAGSMRRRGMSQEAIEAALLVENRRCGPPLPDTEVQRIAASIGRYAPASERHASMQGDGRRALLGARYLAREVTHG